MNEVLLIGIIMTVAGIFVGIMGQRKNTQNAWLWALFPIAHGFHEFIEYFMDLYALSFMWERLELLMAILSSAALLAAAIEYNNIIPSPIGKMSGLGMFLASIYFIFIPSEEAIEEMEKIIFTIGNLKAEPFRFYFGTIMVFFAVIALGISLIMMNNQEKKQNVTSNQKIKVTTEVMTSTLVIFAFFEGFESSNPIFVTFRGIMLSFFILIPIFVVYTSQTGLENLIILDASGVILYQYDFRRQKLNLSDEIILSAGFLAAISGYSQEILHGGGTFTLRSNQLYFSLTKANKKIFTLESRSYNKNLERTFLALPEKIESLLEGRKGNQVENNPTINELLESHFQRFK